MLPDVSILLNALQLLDHLLCERQEHKTVGTI